MVSAIGPARRAVRIAPVEAVSEQQVEDEISMRRRFTWGAGITLAGVAALAVGLTAPAIQLVGLGAVLIFIGVARLAPAVARPMASVLGRPLARLLGMSGRLGRENSMRSPRRTAQTASALMVGPRARLRHRGLRLVPVAARRRRASTTRSAPTSSSATPTPSGRAPSATRCATIGRGGARRHGLVDRLRRPVRGPRVDPVPGRGLDHAEPLRHGHPEHELGDRHARSRRATC